MEGFAELHIEGGAVAAKFAFEFGHAEQHGLKPFMGAGWICFDRGIVIETFEYGGLGGVFQADDRLQNLIHLSWCDYLAGAFGKGVSEGFAVAEVTLVVELIQPDCTIQVVGSWCSTPTRL